jgi:hypothetical protein
MNPIFQSKNHLRKSKMSYLIHFRHAFSLGSLLIIAGITSVIHAIFPFLFPDYSAKKVIRMHVRVVLNSANPDIQNYLARELGIRKRRQAKNS